MPRRTNKDSHRILYHYTANEWLPDILRSGEVLTTESNISRYREHAGPDVVWLTRSPKPVQVRQQSSPRLLAQGIRVPDKCAVRITVRVPANDAHHWPAWSMQQGMDADWYRDLCDTRKGHDPHNWYVVLRAIPIEGWGRIEQTSTGEAIWEAR